MAKVEIIDPEMIKRNGRTMHLPLEKARLGEKKGRWKIVSVDDPSGIYQDRELKAAGPQNYLTRDSFEKPVRVVTGKGEEGHEGALTFKDTFGMKKEDAEKGGEGT